MIKEKTYPLETVLQDIPFSKADDRFDEFKKHFDKNLYELIEDSDFHRDLFAQEFEKKKHDAFFYGRMLQKFAQKAPKLIHKAALKATLKIISYSFFFFLPLLNLPLFAQSSQASGGVYYGKTVHDPIGTEKLVKQIKLLKESVLEARKTTSGIYSINNEINGMRGQLQNVYNQSFGFIGEANRLKQDIESLSRDLVRKATSVRDNIDCLINSDLTELQKKETLLKAYTIDYSSTETQENLARKGNTTLFEKHLGPKVRIPRNVKNLSPCGSIMTSRGEYREAKKNYVEYLDLYKHIYKEDLIKDSQRVQGVPEDELYKTVGEFLNDFIEKRTQDSGRERTVAEIASDQIELQLLEVQSLLSIDKTTKGMLLLELNKNKEAVQSAYARELYKEVEARGFSDIGKPLTQADTKRQSEMMIIDNRFNPDKYYK